MVHFADVFSGPDLTTNPFWDKTLNGHGRKVVMRILDASSGGPKSTIPALNFVTRAYVQKWLDELDAKEEAEKKASAIAKEERDAAKEARREKLENSRHRSTRNIAIVAVLVSAISAAVAFYSALRPQTSPPSPPALAAPAAGQSAPQSVTPRP
jgi:hypothetical protein